MIFNDIDSRLRRLYKAVDSVFIKDHTDQVSFSNQEKVNTSEEVIKVNFGPTDPDEVLLRIETIISMLARMKDSLKNSLKQKGLNPQLAEDVINNSFPLQLIIDLDNQFKHTYPLKQTNRSKKNPLIVNVQSFIKMPGAISEEEMADKIYNDMQNGTSTAGARINFDLKTGEHTYQHNENTTLIISADIVDEHQNFILFLDDLVNDSLLVWEMFVSKHKLKTAPV